MAGEIVEANRSSKRRKHNNDDESEYDAEGNEQKDDIWKDWIRFLENPSNIRSFQPHR